MDHNFPGKKAHQHKHTYTRFHICTLALAMRHETLKKMRQRETAMTKICINLYRSGNKSAKGRVLERMFVMKATPHRNMQKC